MATYSALPTSDLDLCNQGGQQLMAWLKAEPRLMPILPEMLALPTHLLTAASAEGDLYLDHVRDCSQCRRALAHTAIH